MCQGSVAETCYKEEASTTEVSIIGIDLAKNVFQAHGADAIGRRVFSKKLSRSQLLKLLSVFPPCLVAMEACSSVHYWGRRIAELGHEVRLIQPIYVKPFVKRQKNDAADAEAASRPTMRFVQVKSAEQQAAGMAFKTRDLFVRQKTQAINALRGHLAEYGVVAPQGAVHLKRLQAALADEEDTFPEAVKRHAELILDQIGDLQARIAQLDEEIAAASRADERAARLMTIPGVSPVTAAAILALAPDPAAFRRGRDFSAWMGLTPRQHSSGGIRAALRRQAPSSL
ncbi:IS110 family transposase [Ruegeria sp. ANG-R]|uniref:IS110 family transposase n=1 Tax=Ruegeria sp. ANG-R TaxID=1577903 RepID=UPI00126A4754|nr:IS110 family transposase [Ruegeria sp. ANG-R]